MPMEVAAVKQSMPTAVPMMGTLGITIEELEIGRALCRLPDQQPYHNHVGGPHAGAMFTLAESASGAVVLLGFGDRLADATPLAVDATIRYRKLAMGDVTAEAVTSRSVEDVLEELNGGGRPEFDVDVTIRNGEGVTTGEMKIRWTLKPNRKA